MPIRKSRLFGVYTSEVTNRKYEIRDRAQQFFLGTGQTIIEPLLNQLFDGPKDLYEKILEHERLQLADELQPYYVLVVQLGDGLGVEVLEQWMRTNEDRTVQVADFPPGHKNHRLYNAGPEFLRPVHRVSRKVLRLVYPHAPEVLERLQQIEKAFTFLQEQLAAEESADRDSITEILTTLSNALVKAGNATAKAPRAQDALVPE